MADRTGGPRWRDRTLLEVRYAARRLIRTPGFAIVSGVTLAVAVGANVTIFSLVDGVLLRPLSFSHSDRFVAIRHTAPGLGLAETDLSDGTYVHYRAHNTVFEEMAYWQEAVVNITEAGRPERVPLVLVTRSFFPVFGVAPMLGPGFDPDASGGSQMVILSHGLWKRRYGGDSTLVGRTIEVNHRHWRVMGVMPPGFAFPDPRVDLWLDIGDPASAPEELRFGRFHYPGVARLRPGVTPERAAADLRRLVPGLEGVYPDATPETLARARLTPVVVPLKDHVVRDVGSMLWPLFGAVLFVLLIACANVTNLYVVRSAARERDVMVRAALGANRADLMRHFLAESVLLAAVGGALGL
ncbi:MAG: ABC transporter permease, partial [Dehalococcoidia bacterium]